MKGGRSLRFKGLRDSVLHSSNNLTTLKPHNLKTQPHENSSLAKLNNKLGF
jgi:hypothetical protein